MYRSGSKTVALEEDFDAADERQPGADSAIAAGQDRERVRAALVTLPRRAQAVDLAVLRGSRQGSSYVPRPSCRSGTICAFCYIARRTAFVSGSCRKTRVGYGPPASGEYVSDRALPSGRDAPGGAGLRSRNTSSPASSAQKTPGSPRPCATGPPTAWRDPVPLRRWNEVPCWHSPPLIEAGAGPWRCRWAAAATLAVGLGYQTIQDR